MEVKRKEKRREMRSVSNGAGCLTLSGACSSPRLRFGVCLFVYLFVAMIYVR